MFKKLNTLGSTREPFLVIVNFLATKVIAIPICDLEKYDVKFSIKNKTKPHKHLLKIDPISFVEYRHKFNKVIDEIKKGNTYLLNLTQPTTLKTNLTLQEIYDNANALYKLKYKDEFVCFSPESFINIKDNKISTFPMKGTIKANIKNAKKKLLNDEKELAEHTMVVDLLRNDLNLVASNVKVEKFRYITKANDLLQVSSHISGTLEDNWQDHIGDILQKVLPAGSISGTPKKRTLEIIKEVESYDRGFFSGIFGVFDGRNFDSAVMIRFIEKTNNTMIYKSGGGITINSKTADEYREMLDKIYIP